MLDYIKLDHVGPASTMEIDFGDRLTLITGDNGVGKTFALDLAWWALTRTWSGREAFPHRFKGVKPQIEYRVVGKTTNAKPVSVQYDFRQQQWRLPARRPPMPGLVLYIRVDGSYSVWDPARNYWKEARSMGVSNPDRPPAYHFDRRSIWDGLSIGDKVICNGLIRDWVTWQLQKAEAFDQLCSAIKMLSPTGVTLEPGPPVRISIDDARDIPTLSLPYGVVPITHASAGMRRVLGAAYLLVWAREEHRKASELINQAPDNRLIVLFDEVETHLHPKWQRRIVPSLLKAACTLGSDTLQCVISTHSALVMASVEPFFNDTQDRILNMDMEGDQVIVNKVAWYKRGDADTWFTDEHIFDLSSTHSTEAEQAIERATAFMKTFGQGEPTPEQREEAKAIEAALANVLSELDPYWRRWLHFVDVRGLQ
ncbi:MAG: AAA family ATPase [Myxococcota bacterium]